MSGDAVRTPWPMAYDLHDTIAAIAPPAGGRGARRRAAQRAADASSAWARCFVPAGRRRSCGARCERPRRRVAVQSRVRGSTADGAVAAGVPGDLLLWPAMRSYTRQPSAEFHTIGSPPLLAAVVEAARAARRPAGASPASSRCGRFSPGGST